MRAMMVTGLASVLTATVGNARLFGFTLTDAELIGLADNALTKAAEEGAPQSAF